MIPLSGILVNESAATPEAVQIDSRTFIDGTDYVPEDFINHSCRPNLHCDVVKRQFIAIKNIRKNENLTFNYLTTEYDMKKLHTDFTCLCGSQKCFGAIRGFKYLTLKQKKKLEPYLSPFLKTKIKERT